MKSKNTILAVLLMLILVMQAIAQSTSKNTKTSSSSKGNDAGVISPQGGLSLAVLGSGTPGRLTKWIGLTSSNSFIGDTTIFESKVGLVGIGTDAPTSKLTVQGMIETTLGGLKFPDGTVQTTSAAGSLFSVAHDDTLVGDGTIANPLGLKLPLQLFKISIQPLISLLVPPNNCIGCSTFLAGAADTNIAVTASIGPVFPRANTGVQGVSQTGIGVLGQSSGSSGVVGEIIFGNDQNAAGIRGRSTTPSPAGIFEGSVKINDNGNGSPGDLTVAGNLNVTGTKNFKIDHPTDPENRYLYHAAIESNEVLNVYSGNIVTDGNGNAVVELPEYYEALNKDSRYQLTVIGSFSRAIIAEKIQGNRFKVKTDAPNVEVSWQVTGVRSDASLRKRPFKAEEPKAAAERGFYLDPEAFGQPEEKGVDWGRSPELMQQLKKQRLEITPRQN